MDHLRACETIQYEATLNLKFIPCVAIYSLFQMLPFLFFLPPISILVLALLINTRRRPNLVFSTGPWLLAGVLALLAPGLILFGIFQSYSDPLSRYWGSVLLAIYLFFALVFHLSPRIQKGCKTCKAIRDSAIEFFPTIYWMIGRFENFLWVTCLLLVGLLEASTTRSPCPRIRDTLSRLGIVLPVVALAGICFLLALVAIFWWSSTSSIQQVMTISCVLMAAVIFFVILRIICGIILQLPKSDFWIYEAAIRPLLTSVSGRWISMIEKNEFSIVEEHDFESGVFNNRIRVAHLSDLHIPASEATKLTEEQPWPSRAIEKLSIAIAEVERAGRVSIVCSGDTTDTGHADAWKKFADEFEEFSDRIVLAPGNHDLNIVGYGALSLLLDADGVAWQGRARRMRNFLEFAARMMGHRAAIYSKDGTKEDLVSVWARVKGLSDGALLQESESLFPIWVHTAVEKEVFFVVWNTVRPSRFAAFNSAGEVNRVQLDNFIRTRQHPDFRGHGLIHVMHHKLGFPATSLKWYAEGGLWSRILKPMIQLAGMVMANADDVVKAIRIKGTHPHRWPQSNPWLAGLRQPVCELEICHQGSGSTVP